MKFFKDDEAHIHRLKLLAEHYRLVGEIPLSIIEAFAFEMFYDGFKAGKRAAELEAQHSHDIH